MRLSVLIPTFKRPGYLEKSLRGLRQQRRKPDQVVIGLRADDQLTRDYLNQGGADGLPIQTIFTELPGVVASMNAAADQTTGDIVCLLDDDAEPLPDWLEKMETHFEKAPLLGVLGGRDLLQDHPEMRRDEPKTPKVGRFEWFGRIQGNHHRGTGGCRKVDLVKGCNAAVRGPLLRQIHLETQLRGSGAQVHWELALCLDAANRGYKVAYDPAIEVIHHIAPRHDEDQLHRGHFSATGIYDSVWNEHYIVGSRCRLLQRAPHLFWSLMVGSTMAPGLAQYLRLRLRRDPHGGEKLQITLRAIRDARHHLRTHPKS